MTFIPFSPLMARSEFLAVQAGDTNGNQSSKSILYFIIVVAAVLFLVAVRICILRRRNRSVTKFFLFRPSNSQTPREDHAFSSYEPSHRMHHLTPLPSAYRPDRRVNAADTDSSGRRIGAPDDPDWDGKDILPAYDIYDRPPKYDSGGSMPHAQGYIPPSGSHPRDDTVVANTEVIPVAGH
ncbi:uncharacterized protein EDB93DRAFT_827101 [Suillus bovinus]|uniref:uncharacterized protein n=1 Tax=Suillus bovinus TaxID=48563 RepID=UPI001B866665|nr:uncharacterized protein EDB93DRAFT_827101 [Suillus bovinus]KAG2135390.1 hypothetical protein EDB93DRAFT_827101 [Suillus bovinus]